MKRKTVWMCAACGKTGKTRDSIGDESCYMWGTLVWEDSIVRENGAVCDSGNPRNYNLNVQSTQVASTEIFSSVGTIFVVIVISHDM